MLSFYYSSLKLPLGVSGWVRLEDVPGIADHHRWLWYATPAQVKSKFSMLGTCEPKWNGRFGTRKKNRRNKAKLANTESESSVIRRLLCNQWVMFYVQNNVFEVMFYQRTQPLEVTQPELRAQGFSKISHYRNLTYFSELHEPQESFLAMPNCRPYERPIN